MAYQIPMTDKRDNLRNATAFRETSRVPFLMWAWQWKFIDSDLNITIEEGTRDYEAQKKVAREFLDRYCFDSIYERPCVYATKVLDALGGQPARILNGNRINNIERTIITPETVDDYLRNPLVYQWKSAGSRFHQGLTWGQLSDAVHAQKEYNEQCAQIDAIYTEYGIPRLFTQDKMYMMPVDMVSVFLGGIKDFALMMRRYPGKLDALIEVQRASLHAQVEASMDSPTADDAVFHAHSTYLVHSFMNRKQFERFFWPDLKYVTDRSDALGKTFYHNIEAEIIRFADYFRDLTKGLHCISIEIEDPREVRKAMPNVAIAGGMPTLMLGSSDPDTCVAYAKQLVDDMGEGFILSMDKFMNYAADAKRENMLALNEFVMTYKG